MSVILTPGEARIVAMDPSHRARLKIKPLETLWRLLEISGRRRDAFKRRDTK